AGDGAASGYELPASSCPLLVRPSSRALLSRLPERAGQSSRGNHLPRTVAGSATQEARVSMRNSPPVLLSPRLRSGDPFGPIPRSKNPARGFSAMERLFLG